MAPTGENGTNNHMMSLDILKLEKNLETRESTWLHAPAFLRKEKNYPS
jgi:hypothetical protein